MLTRLAVAALFLPAFNSVIAQGPQLEYVLGYVQPGQPVAEGTAIATDAVGNVYATGNFTGTCDFDPGPAAHLLYVSGPWDDLYITKTDPNGAFLWVKQFESSGCDGATLNTIETDAQGNLIVAGYTPCAFIFDPGPNEILIASTSLFVAKLNAAGDLLWLKQIGTTQGTPFDIAVQDDAIIVIGNFQGVTDFDPGVGVFNMSTTGYRDAFILKLDNNGDFIAAWEFDQLGGNWEVYPVCIATYSNNDIVIGGWFRGLVDFDPSPVVYQLYSDPNTDGFICRLTANGELLWVDQLGGTGDDKVTGIAIDQSDNVVITGDYEAEVDMDPGPGISTLASLGGSDVWIAKYDGQGELVWAGSVGSEVGSEYAYDLTLAEHDNIWVIGNCYGVIDFDLGLGTYLPSSDGQGGFIAKWDNYGLIIWAGLYGGSGAALTTRPTNGIVVTGQGGGSGLDLDPGPEEYFLAGSGAYILAMQDKGIGGTVYNDLTENCFYDLLEPSVAGRTIEIEPIGYLAQTNTRGGWSVDSLPPGTYVARVDYERGPWSSNCSTEYPFTISADQQSTLVEPFGLVSTEPCSMPDVSLAAPTLRRCFEDQRVYVAACNQLSATSTLSAAYVEVEFDTLLLVTGCDHPYTLLGGSRYRLDISDLLPGQCFHSVFYTTVNCATTVGQTLCMSGELFPVDECALDTVPGAGSCATAWDGSHIKVNSYCLDDTVYFTIRNTGQPGVGDMTCFSNVRVYLDGVLYEVDSVQLAGGETYTFSFPGNGQTWRLEVDQHPLHPGNSQPNAVQERCGLPVNWTPRLVTTQYMDDADPVIDIHCGMVSAGLDPNDKIGYPTGLQEDHFILHGQQLQYMIRFQNTGNDTTFTVIIRDTLDVSLNAFTVVPGVASHPYTFRMYGPRVMEWRFENILLPDSTTDNAGSNGFVTYRVDQVGGLSNWTVIRNVAAIYFDYNDPVLTEPSIHTVHDMFFLTTQLENTSGGQDGIRAYPNPTHDGRFLCEIPIGDAGDITIYDTQGRSVLRNRISANQRTAAIDMSNEPAGVYFIEHRASTGRSTIRIIKY